MNLHPSHRAHLERRHAVALANVNWHMDSHYHRAHSFRRLRHWANECHKLEDMLYPIPPPTPEEAAQFRAEQEGRA